MKKCDWCGAEIRKQHKQQDGYLFCSVAHREQFILWGHKDAIYRAVARIVEQQKARAS